MDLGDIAAEGRFDRQIALVREYWTSVRRLWLDETDVSEALPHIRSDLPEDFILGVGMPGLANITHTRDGLFEFAEPGVTAVIIAAYDTIPGNLDANADSHVEHLADLVAVDLDRPERHWRRRGEAIVLGAAFLEIAGQEGAPIMVFKTPMSWLLSGGAGVCILDWGWARNLLLDLELVAEGLDLGARLEDALKPSIWIGRVAA